MPGAVHQHDEELARRVYSYFIFRLRQPEDAQRLTRLTFKRIWEQEKLSSRPDAERELPVFASARAVIADTPRPRGASKYVPTDAKAGDGGRARLSDSLSMAIGRWHGRERDALALRFGAELSVGEIAELLNRSPAEVKQRLARGTRTLIELGVLPKEGAGASAAEGTGPGSPEKGEPEKDETGA